VNITKKASVLVGAALVLGSLGTATATASPGTPECVASNLQVSVHERPSPNVQDQLFMVIFDAKPGTTCTMKGTLGNLVFHDASGTSLPVPVVSPDPTEADEVVVAPDHSKVAYVASKKGTGQGFPVAGATFTLPSRAPSDRDVKVAWPNSFSGPARLGYIGEFFG